MKKGDLKAFTKPIVCLERRSVWEMLQYLTYRLASQGTVHTESPIH